MIELAQVSKSLRSAIESWINFFREYNPRSATSKKRDRFPVQYNTRKREAASAGACEAGSSAVINFTSDAVVARRQYNTQVTCAAACIGMSLSVTLFVGLTSSQGATTRTTLTWNVPTLHRRTISRQFLPYSRLIFASSLRVGFWGQVFEKNSRKIDGWSPHQRGTPVV